jgi:ABC-type multidrug transport system ATPase subunit
VLFDEATRSLDPGRAARIRRVIRELLVERERRAVLFATHDLDEARALSDEVVLLEGGRVAARGAYDQVAPALVDAFRREADEEEREYARILARAGEATT